MIGRILVPVFGIDNDRLLLDVGAEVATPFHAHIEVVRAGAGRGNLMPQDNSGARRPDVGSGADTAGDEVSRSRLAFDHWRERHHILEQPEYQHHGLTSASFLELEGPAETELPRRAKLSDLTCIAIRPFEDAGQPRAVIRQLLFSTGRPLLLVPVTEGLEASRLVGEPMAIGWNGTVEAVHAVAAALPLIRVSREVEVISLDETTAKAMDAYELATYLSWHGVKARAVGVGRQDWTGRDVIDVFQHRGARVLVMGAHSRGSNGMLGNATRDILQRVPTPVILSA